MSRNSMGQTSVRRRVLASCTALGMLVAFPAFSTAAAPLAGQGEPAASGPARPQAPVPQSHVPQGRSSEGSGFEGTTTADYNRRLDELQKWLEPRDPGTRSEDYRVGPEDLLDITVFEAPEMNRSVRVSASGEISLPLLGAVQAAGLTPRELEFVLEELLRRTYMKDPHAGVQVREMQSHAVSVFGAVRKPGVFQVRGVRTLIEVLSLAEGLADDAGDTVLVMRPSGFSAAGPGSAVHAPSSPSAEEPNAAIEIQLQQLLHSADPRTNVPVHPGDIVKVTRAGIIYVVGEVKKPGGYLLRTNENISALQAIALAEGLTRTAARKQARIIRTQPETGRRTELALDLGKVLAGKAGDPVLQPRDIVFIPNSAARSGFYRGAEAAVSVVSGLIVFRR